MTDPKLEPCALQIGDRVQIVRGEPWTYDWPENEVHTVCGIVWDHHLGKYNIHLMMEGDTAPTDDFSEASLRVVGHAWNRRATPQPDAATTIERLRAELDKAKWRYQWCANELLGCDYGDNETGQMGWLVYGWRDKSGQRRIYGASIDEAVDAQIALSRIDTKGGE